MASKWFTKAKLMRQRLKRLELRIRGLKYLPPEEEAPLLRLLYGAQYSEHRAAELRGLVEEARRGRLAMLAIAEEATAAAALAEESIASLSDQVEERLADASRQERVVYERTRQRTRTTDFDYSQIKVSTDQEDPT